MRAIRNGFLQMRCLDICSGLRIIVFCRPARPPIIRVAIWTMFSSSTITPSGLREKFKSTISPVIPTLSGIIRSLSRYRCLVLNTKHSFVPWLSFSYTLVSWVQWIFWDSVPKRINVPQLEYTCATCAMAWNRNSRRNTGIWDCETWGSSWSRRRSETSPEEDKCRSSTIVEIITTQQLAEEEV